MPHQNNEIKTVKALINECLQELKPYNSTRLIDARYIIDDMGISERNFRTLQEKMPFLFRITPNSTWKARLCDYEKWKEELANKSS
jgi:hypothetical protein